MFWFLVCNVSHAQDVQVLLLCVWNAGELIGWVGWGGGGGERACYSQLTSRVISRQEKDKESTRQDPCEKMKGPAPINTLTMTIKSTDRCEKGVEAEQAGSVIIFVRWQNSTQWKWLWDYKRCQYFLHIDIDRFIDFLSRKWLHSAGIGRDNTQTQTPPPPSKSTANTTDTEHTSDSLMY